MFNKKNIALVLSGLLLFVAGGWFFTSLFHRASGIGIQAQPRQDFARASSFSVQVPAEPELLVSPAVLAANTTPKNIYSGKEPPSQLSKIQVAGMAGIISRAQANKQDAAQAEKATQEKKEAPLHIDVKAKPAGTFEVPASSSANTAQETSISMIEAPVVHRLIQTLEEYKKFKTQAKGSYPKVDFAKEMLVVLESNSNLPDKVFQIHSAQFKNGKLEVLYSVNVFGLDQKINTHTVKVVKKTAAPIELKQVL